MDWRAVMRFCRACYFTMAERRFTRGLPFGCALIRNRASHHGRTPIHTRITAWLRFAAQSGIAQWPRTASHADYSLAALCAQSGIAQWPRTASHADYRLAVLYCAVGHCTMAAHRFTRGLSLGCALLRSRASHNGRTPLHTRITAWLCIDAKPRIKAVHAFSAAACRSATLPHTRTAAGLRRIISAHKRKNPHIPL